MESPDKLEGNWRNPDGTLKSGHPGMGGRPKGETMKEFARRFLASMSPEEKMAWLSRVSADTIWKMSEGNPAADPETSVNIINTVELTDEQVERFARERAAKSGS